MKKSKSYFMGIVVENQIGKPMSIRQAGSDEYWMSLNDECYPDMLGFLTATGLEGGDLAVGSMIINWNDAPGRTKEEVIEGLRVAALIAKDLD